MLKYALYISLGIAVFAIIGYIWFIYAFGHNFMKPGPRYTEAQYQHIRDRLEFNMAYRGEIIDSLLVDQAKKDTTFTIHEDLSPDEMPDSSSHCWCYCSNFTRTLKFDTAPKEIYLVTYGMGDHSVGIDWVIKFENNKWKCHPTSVLDSVEQLRIEKRFRAIVAEFPAKDTSARSSTWQGHVIDYDTN